MTTVSQNLTTDNHLPAAALWYAERLHWPIFPCGVRSKEPATAHAVRDASIDLDQVREWWAASPAANIAFHVGGAGLIALDFDTAKAAFAGADLLQDLLTNHPTTTAATGSGGRHLLYQQPPGAQLGNSRGALPVDVDARGWGGYILVAPSIHPNGTTYQWCPGTDPHTMAPAPLPDFVLAMLTATKSVRAAPSPAVAPVSLDDQALIVKMRNGAQGSEFDRLWRGDTSMQHGDHSAADAALLRILAYWTARDAARMDALFRQSGLYRQKWERHDYRDRSIQHAIDMTANVYQPGATIDPAAVAAAQAAVNAQPPQPGSGPAPAGMGKAVVTVSADLGVMRDKTLSTLLAANDPPRLFVAAEGLADVTENGAGPKIRLMSKAALLNRMVDTATWQDATGKPTMPPKDAADLILALPDLPFPRLAQVVLAPVFGPDGRLYDQPGYVADLELLVRHDLAILDSEPTPQAVQTARSLWLDELLKDFPFADEASKAHALALGLLPFVRPMIDGATPMHLIDAALRGSGKGLLAAALTIPALGRPAPSQSLSSDESEVRKMLFASLLEGRSHLFFDNLTRLDSDALALALTQDAFSDRVLGASVTKTAPIRCVWAATANNSSLSEDLARRCAVIRLEPLVEEPEHRTGFRHGDLLEWAQANRAGLVWAALVLVRNWIERGRPKSGAIKGSFQKWCDVVGGILAAAGVPGFLANEGILAAKATDREVWRLFIAEWWATHGAKPVTIDDLQALALPEALNPTVGVATWQGLLDDILTYKDLRGARRSLGNTLPTWQGRVIGIEGGVTSQSIHLVLRAGRRTKAGTQWSLEQV